MHASQESLACSSIGSFYRQPIQKNDPSWLSNFQVLNTDSRGSGPFHVFTEQFFTLESTPAAIHIIHNSPSAAIPSPSMCTFSPQLWNSYISQVTRSSENAYQSPSSGSGRVDEESNLIPALWMVRNGLLGSKFDTHSRGSFNGVVAQPSPLGRCNRNMEITPPMDLKQLLISIAETVSAAGSLSLSDRNVAALAAEALMNLLEKWVSISGEPLQRLGAYMLEGLRARLLSTGNIIYKKLKCNQPTSSELMSYMHVLFQICPYWKFAYTSANAVIEEAMECENRIHVIDFQIAQGSQWISFIHSLSLRPGRRLSFRLTGVDDSQSAHARGGGLQMISQRLAEVAESCGVPFVFHAAAMSGCEIKPENLHIQPGEA